MKSYWTESSCKTNYPSLDKNINVDICIIGGGLTGIATAYMLSENRKFNILILEADRFGMGITANTTAKITSQHGLIYNYLENSFDKSTASAYLKSNEEAIKLIENIIKKENIDCDFIKQDSFVYTCQENNIIKIKDEQETLKNLDFPSEYLTEISLPFKIRAAIKFPNQAQFHPRKYLLSLLSIIEKRNIKIYENTRVVDIKYSQNNYKLYANNYTVNCKYLIMTTHYPIKNFPGMYFLKMYQDSSYAIAIDQKSNYKNFDGMYISCDTPVTSFRNIFINDEKKFIIIGGSGHKTGATNINIESAYKNLENYANKIFPKSKVKYRWMTEDCVTLDKIPYIGDFSKLLPNMFVATGFKKWGMTTSHVAAKIISDKILNIDNPYAKIYDSTRFSPIKNHKEFGNMLKQSVYSLAINKFSKPNINFNEIEKDCGGVVNYKGEKIGVYRDISGETFTIVPYCKHLGCELSWNNLEKIWECPCHGSRYDYKGNIITEPSVFNLERKFIPDKKDDNS